MLPTRLIRFVRTFHILSAVLPICGLQMYAQPLSIKNWVDLARARAGRQASPQTAASGPKATGTYTTIDIPGATFFFLEGINPRGDIVGAYYDSSFTLHNFLLSNGTFQEINPPGAGLDFLFEFLPQTGINPRGDIVANYADSSGNHGFLLSKGTYTLIDDPEASPQNIGTWPARINPSGEIVGSYFDSSGGTHGFLLSKGVYTTIDAPVSLGAVPGSTVGAAIDPQGNILGQYNDSSGNTHGFLLSHGKFETIDVPGSPFTAPLDMNPQGEIVGAGFDSNNNFFGFLLSHGTVTIIDVPGSCSGCTMPYGINPQGDIVGTYLDNSGLHGFLLKRN